MGGKSSPAPTPTAAAPQDASIVRPEFRKKPDETGTKIITTPTKAPGEDEGGANPLYSNSVLGR